MVVRADSDSGPSEIRDLAGAFNLLATHNAQNDAAQVEALRLQQVAFDLGRAIRVSSSIQEAELSACAQLGPALHASRVAVNTFDEIRKVAVGGQWHVPGLDDVTSVTHERSSVIAKKPVSIMGSSCRSFGIATPGRK